MSMRAVTCLAVALALVAHGSIALASEEAHPPAGGVNPLTLEEIQGDLAIWTAVVFLVLMAILWKFAWGPITQGLERREQAVADQIAQAEHSNQEAQQLLTQYEQKLADSKDEVREIISQARRDAEQVGQELVEKAKQEAQAEQQRALQQIDAATANALNEIAERGSTLAIDLAGKIVRAELKPQDHAQLIDQTVGDFARQKPSNN